MTIFKFDVLVIGDANVDLILRGEDLVPDFGQAEKLIDDASMELGGSAAIFACGASRLGLKVGFIGKLGDDPFGAFLLKVMNGRGIDTSHVIMDMSKKTGMTVHFSRPQDRAMLTYTGTIDSFQCNDIDMRLFSHTRHVHLGSYFLQTGLHSGLADCFERIKSTGATISLDPGWDPVEKWNSSLGRVLKQLDIFMPNEEELKRITAKESVSEAIQLLMKSPLLPVIKLGKKGACSISNGEIIVQPSFEVNNIDTTGAGDSFNAGFLFAYLNQKDIEECLRWGCACGALSTMFPGGIEGQPSREEVEKFLSLQASG